MMRRPLLFRLMAAIVALIALGGEARAAEADKGILADLLSRALSSPTTSVSIGAVEGALSSDASISDIVLSDRNGPWLKIDKVRLVWNRLALFSRRLEVDRLTIGHVQFLRRPLASGTPPPEGGSILPELPLKVIVKQFGLQELTLGEPVIGVAARLTIDGRATLGPPSEGLDLSLAARRLDAPGDFKAVMTYVPAAQKLTLAVNSEEPAGGLFAHLVNLPGLPPVRLAFNGAGALDNFDARLDFAAGPDTWARGDVVVAREGAGRKLTLDLNSRLEGMAPPLVRPIFAGETTLRGDLVFGDDSTIATPGLRLVSASARLDIVGGRSADNTLGIKINAGAIPGSEIGKLDLDASIAGPALSPTIEGAIEAGGVHVEQGSLDRVSATFRAVPNGTLTQESTRIAFEGQAAMSGLALADPALARVVGSEAKLIMRGSASLGGDIAFDKLDLSSHDFDARYSGLLAPKKVHGRLEVTARDLSRFAPLAGGVLKGEARLAADLDGAPRYSALTATIDAHATHLATAYSMFDRLTGGDLHLGGVARTTPGGGFGFTDLIASGAHGQATLNGDFGRDKVNLDASINVPEARVLDPRVSGKAEIAATLTGAPDDLNATLKASLSEGRLLDRKTSGVTLEAEAANITGQVQANASASGDIDGHKLLGSAHVAKTADSGWLIDNLALSLASAKLKGNVAIGPDQLATGALSFSAANLDDLSPLVLTKMSGALQAEVNTSGTDGKQAVAITATSERMAFGANRLEGLKLDLTIGDLWGARSVSGVAQLTRAEVAGQTISGVKLTATGRGDSSDLDFTGSVFGFALNAQGRLSGGPPIRFDLAAFTAQRGGQKIALAGPAALTYGKDGIGIENLALRVGSGRLSLSGHAGSTLDLRATAAALPLSAFDLVSPGLGASGTADGEATIRGTPSAPIGDWRLRLTQVSTPQTRSNALPPLDVAASGRLASGRTSVDATANAGGANALRVTGSAPLASDGPLDLRIDGRLDASLANNALSLSGQRMTGALTLALQLRGPLLKPEAQGSIRLANGEFRDDQTGFRLSGITGLLNANADTVRIERLSASTPNGGTISASGDLRLDPVAGFPGSIRVTGKHAQLVASTIVAATADLDLTLTGKLAQRPNVGGRIAIDSMDITVPGRFNSVSAPIPGTKHVNPTPTVKARLAQIARANAARSGGAPFDATLNLTISAANRIVVRGRGIYAELGGELHVAGLASDPQVRGGFDLLRGSLTLVGRRLVFTQGQVRFHGGVIPELNLVAETSAADVTARIAVTGPANHPTFAITSQPSLPQDEILSRILFQQPSGSLSAFQAIELANAVGTLSGNFDAFEHLRRTLGVDSLDISTSATGGALVGATRAINDRISVGVTTGARPQDNGVNVDLDVTRHLRLQSGVDASGGSSAGVGAHWEYK
ncbi:MAG TPA: translocation/assembly module TamB domain-containing protein [Roseiarcus sp.]|nr:translocation/assembly module TamB domain-containing protein [Roseiarcus sp.]